MPVWVELGSDGFYRQTQQFFWGVVDWHDDGDEGLIGKIFNASANQIFIFFGQR
ncbi:hypothetical protein THIOM_004970 [Candidatus Thiomargarita nelsonii]|uniref:Uncharacterized protein n=1 Tax=Candidatus Thiomargarita nelsonii TaxID=1003181 RepID=A0A176RUI6_9GAMM|nr:hypothetical protein THIOM_004970 [Candidatus Thiomargarita nelsonii]